ncbi:hypothetical protein ACC739_37620, partial [Rhizobium ruizarguesonis]
AAPGEAGNPVPITWRVTRGSIVEFTIERGRLWMLQTRSGKRSTRAAMKIAVDMVDEGVITEDEEVLRIEPSSLDQLLHPTI